MLLVSLISEQTIPNLLPILHLKPEVNLFVHTTSEKNSLKPAQRLKNLVTGSEVQLLQVDAYRADRIYEKLKQAIPEGAEVVFNLTGGTKPMPLAAFQLAQEIGARCIYYQTEGARGRDQQSVLHWYRIEGSHLAFENSEPLPDLLNLDIYLHAYLDGYQENAPDPSKTGYDLETAVRHALQNKVDEWKTSVVPQGIKDQAEIDLMIRRGNNIAVLEIKSGGEGSNKKALDQLTTIVAREYLGTYASRVIFTRSDSDSKSSWYKALAAALRVEVIEMQFGLKNNRLDERDQRILLQRIDQILPPRP